MGNQSQQTADRQRDRKYPLYIRYQFYIICIAVLLELY